MTGLEQYRVIPGLPIFDHCYWCEYIDGGEECDCGYHEAVGAVPAVILENERAQ